MPKSQDTKSTSSEASARAEHLRLLYHTFRRVVRGIYFRPNEGSPLLEMPILQVRCLNAIAEKEGQRMVDVAARASVGLPGASRTVERLVRMGLVIREQDPQDRRAVQLSLTDSARALLAGVEAARLDYLAQITTDLACDDLEKLLAGLTLLAEAGEKSLQDSGSVPLAPAYDPLVVQSRPRRSRRIPSP